MSKLRYLYDLQHIHEIRAEDEEEINVKRLGIFTSRKKVNEAIKNYKKLPGFRDRKEVFDGDEYGEGFCISYIPLGIAYWEGGFTTVADAIIDEEEVTDIILNLPYWFQDKKLQAADSSSEFAESVMQEKYHTSDSPKAPQSEFYQIKKFIEMHNANLL